jgi:hypothetical protein
MSETLFVKEIMLYLQQRKDIMCWRNNVGAGVIGNRFVQFGCKGHADIFAILEGGKFIAIEAKYGKGKQSKDQKTFQEQIEALGAKYILAYKLEDVIDGLPQYDAPLVVKFRA